MVYGIVCVYYVSVLWKVVFNTNSSDQMLAEVIIVIFKNSWPWMQVLCCLHWTWLLKFESSLHRKQAFQHLPITNHLKHLLHILWAKKSWFSASWCHHFCFNSGWFEHFVLNYWIFGTQKKLYVTWVLLNVKKEQNLFQWVQISML